METVLDARMIPLLVLLGKEQSTALKYNATNVYTFVSFLELIASSWFIK